jgi:hypothetical protein
VPENTCEGRASPVADPVPAGWLDATIHVGVGDPAAAAPQSRDTCSPTPSSTPTPAASPRPDSGDAVQAIPSGPRTGRETWAGAESPAGTRADYAAWSVVPDPVAIPRGRLGHLASGTGLRSVMAQGARMIRSRPTGPNTRQGRVSGALGGAGH